MRRSDDALYHATVLPVVLKADQCSHDEKCVNWNEAAIKELLTIRAEAEIVRQFSEMVRGALYTSHEMARVFTGSLRDFYGLCVNARTDSGKSQAVWMNQNQTIPGWFPEHITRVFSGISVWKRLV